MGFEEPRDMSQDKRIAREVGRSQRVLVARSALRAVPLNIVNAVLLGILIFDYANPVALAVWLTVLVIAPTLRFSAMLRARRADRAPTRLEMTAYVLLSGVVGLAWGMTPFIAGPQIPALTAQIMALVIAGMAAGAVLTAAGNRYVIWAYSAPALGLWGLSLVLTQPGPGMVAATMLALFFGAMTLLARTYTLTLTDAVTANVQLEAERANTEAQAEAMARLAEHNDQAARRAEEAARSSAVMLANMSHELRSPLNGVLGLSQLLEEAGLQPEHARMANRIRQSGQTLEGLINTVLEVSRIEAGRLELVLEDITARDIADRIERRAGALAASKGVALDFDLSGDAERALRGDGGRIIHMARILVSNAIRFTDEGAVTVRISVNPASEGAARLRVEVHDTGCGVPESARSQLFNAMAFDSVDENIKESGTGLGLLLVQRLADLMNGEAGYQPAEVGTGSVFWFELGLRHSVRSDRYADGEQMSVANRRLRVLVGEADSGRQSVLLGYLKSFNCVVTCVGAAAEMSDALGAAAYDAVVLGERLTDADPEDAAADIRALPSTASMTPVLRLDAGLDTALRLNASETLVRSPVSADALLEGLKSALANDPIAGAQLHRIA